MLGRKARVGPANAMEFTKIIFSDWAHGTTWYIPCAPEPALFIRESPLTPAGASFCAVHHHFRDKKALGYAVFPRMT